VSEAQRRNSETDPTRPWVLLPTHIRTYCRSDACVPPPATRNPHPLSDIDWLDCPRPVGSCDFHRMSPFGLPSRPMVPLLVRALRIRFTYFIAHTLCHYEHRGQKTNCAKQQVDRTDPLRDTPIQWCRRPDATVLHPCTGGLKRLRPDWCRRPDATGVQSSTGDSILCRCEGGR
jgi:hypothetical protein